MPLPNMTNGSLLASLLDRLGRADTEAFFGADEVADWPPAGLNWLLQNGLLRRAQPARAIECQGCEENCVMPVHVFAAEDDLPARAFVSCDKRDEVGRVPVDFWRLGQWQTTGDLVAAAVARLLGFGEPTGADGKQWNLGVLKGKKHKSLVMLLAGDGLNLSIAGHTVPLIDVLAIEKNALALDKAELICLVDKPEGESETSGANQGYSGNPCEVYLAMENLTASEVSISFVGESAESGLGANNMLEVSARKETRRVALAALDLVDRRGGSLNSQGAVLLGMAQKKKLPRTGANAAKMKRLREVFRKHFGINGDPFEKYRKGAGWLPHFEIADKRGAADERAKREAERRTDSFEQLNERGASFADTNQSPQSFGAENDAAAEWLKNSDPNESA